VENQTSKLDAAGAIGMYKLFYSLKSASMGIRVLLEEIGASYELIQTSVDKDTPRPPEQLAVNPNGWVPVLLWENEAMYEAAAITMFLGIVTLSNVSAFGTDLTI
jgi:hypothetical protein